MSFAERAAAMDLDVIPDANLKALMAALLTKMEADQQAETKAKMPKVSYDPNADDAKDKYDGNANKRRKKQIIQTRNHQMIHCVEYSYAGLEK